MTSRRHLKGSGFGKVRCCRCGFTEDVVLMYPTEFGFLCISCSSGLRKRFYHVKR